MHQTFKLRSFELLGTVAMEEETAATPVRGKIVAIAVGQAHTLALNEDGFVYSWGKGRSGCLGTGSTSDELRPVRVGFERSGQPRTNRVKIVGVAAGDYHSLAVSDDGLVWSWGMGILGQLAGEDSLIPRLIDYFLKPEHRLLSNALDWYRGAELGFEWEKWLSRRLANWPPLTPESLGSPESDSSPERDPGRETTSHLKVCSIKAGRAMSVAIDDLGCLWMWGHIPTGFSELGSSLSSICTHVPVPILYFHDQIVLKVACGSEHVVALVGPRETYKDDDCGSILYSWGLNDHGQLGLGDRENRQRPHVVETLNWDLGFVVYEIACGAHHSAVLTRKKDTPRKVSVCWTFGLGENGQLGHGDTKSSSIPEPVKELPEHSYFVSVDCGWFHTSLVSSDGYVWTWGIQKGLGFRPSPDFINPKTEDATRPRLVPHKFMRPLQISCGRAHTVLSGRGGYKLWSWGRGGSGELGNGEKLDKGDPTVVVWSKEEREPATGGASDTGRGSREGIKRLRRL